MRGREMSVEITLDDGKTFTRRVETTGKGNTSDVECSWLKNAKSAEHHSAVVDLFGEEEIDAAESLDIRELLAATPGKRAERIETLLSAGTATPKELAELMGELTARRLAGKELTELDNWRHLLRIIPEGQMIALKSAGPMLEAKLTEGGIPTATDWANEEKRRRVKELKQKAAAKKELESRIESMPKGDWKRAKEFREERDRLQRDMGAARERLEGMNDMEADRKQTQDSMAEVEKRIGGVDELVTGAHLDLKKAKQDKKKITALKKKLKSFETDKNAIAELGEEAAALEAKVGDRFQEPEIPKSAFEHAEVTTISAKLASVQSSDWNRVLEIVDLLEKGPVRTADYEPIQELKKLAVKGLGDDPAGLERTLARAKKNLTKAEKAEKTALAKRKKDLEAFGKKRKEVDDLRAKANKLRDEAAPQSRKVDDEIAELERGFYAAENSLKMAEREQKELHDRRAYLKERLAGLSKPKKITDDRVAIQDKIDKVSTDLEAVSGAIAAKGELTAIVMEIERGGAEKAVFDALEWAGKRAREKGITEAGGPLVGAMSTFLDAAGRDEVPYFKADRKACEIGWTNTDGQQVPIQALSGGEWCLFAAALTAAVVSMRKAPLRVLLVEAGEADQATLVGVVAGISAIAEGLTHAIVMTQAVKFPTKTKGWKVIKLEESLAAQ